MEIFFSVFCAGLALMLVYWAFSNFGWYALLLFFALIWLLLSWATYIPARKITKSEAIIQHNENQKRRVAFLEEERSRIAQLPSPLRLWKHMSTFHPIMSFTILYVMTGIVLLAVIIVVDPM